MFGNRAVRARAIAIVTDTIFATLAPALRAGASGEGNPTFHASDNGVTPRRRSPWDLMARSGS
jgi:hypothetical protein